MDKDPDEFHLDYESAGAKEMFAHFGMAVYLAQVFEKGLSNLLAIYLFVENKGKWSRKQYLEEVAKLEKQTLGPLLKKIKKIASFDDAVLCKLELAHQKRNYIAHNFFWINAAKISDIDGRRAVISEAEELRELFTEADRLMEALTEVILEAANINLADVRRFMNQIVAEEIEKSKKGEEGNWGRD